MNVNGTDREYTHTPAPFLKRLSTAAPTWHRDWAKSATLARLTGCPKCSDDGRSCDVCGNTGLVTEERRNLLTIEDLAKLAYETS